MIAEFRRIYEQRHQLGRDAKAKGERVVGYVSSYVPDEIIAAGKFLPVRLRGGTSSPGLADRLFPGFMCSYLRGALEEGLRGEYDYLDGLIVGRTCDGGRTLFTTWQDQIKTPLSFFLAVPAARSQEAVNCLRGELSRLKGALEKYGQRQISSSDLRQAILDGNEHRTLVESLYHEQLADNPPLAGSEVFEVVRAGLTISKAQHGDMLRRLLKTLPGIRSGDRNVRVLVTGSTIEDTSVLRMIEELGGVIAVDDFAVTARHYSGHTDVNCDPLDALAARYLQKSPDPSKLPAEGYTDRVLTLCKDYRVRAVVAINQKYCDNYLFEMPALRQILGEADIPLLALEVDDFGDSFGQFRTRVQAFLEMLR